MRLLYSENDFQLGEKVKFKNQDEVNYISAISLRPAQDGKMYIQYEVTYFNGTFPATCWVYGQDLQKNKYQKPPKSE